MEEQTINQISFKTRFWPFAITVLLVSVIVMAFSIGIVYRSSLDVEQSRLVELVKSQARLIDAVARFDAKFSAADHPDGAEGATLSQVLDALSQEYKFSKSGEFVMGRREGDNIVFLLKSRHLDRAIAPLPIFAREAEPMRLALSGQSGVIAGIDYRKETVIAAYEFIPALGLGLVVKIDLSEFRAPFIKASIIACVVTLVTMVLGILILRQIEGQKTAGDLGVEGFDQASGISLQERFMYLVLIMTIVAGVAIVASVSQLYLSSYDLAKSHLTGMVKSQARLIDAVARFDANFSAHDHPGGAAGATLSQVLDAMNRQQGFGESGEFVMARREADDIIFLTQPRHLDQAIPAVHMMDQAAKPMQQALVGKSGVLVGLDYRSMEVLAAYEHVPSLNVGLVAKVDLSEIRAPFMRAALWSGGIALVAILLGSVILARAKSYAPISTGLAATGFIIEVEEKIPPTLMMFAVVLALTIFVLDLITPLGVAGGVPYAGLVLTGWWFPRRRHTIYLALLSTILVLIGYGLAPEGGIAWVVFTNRAYALIGIWVTALVISASKAVEIARKRQAGELAKLSLAVQYSPSSVIITDPEGIIEYVNDKFIQDTGYERHEALGKKPSLIQSGQTPPETYKELWETIAKGKEWRGELLNKRKNGELYWEQAAILPIKSDDNRVLHFVGLLEDISERKRAEEQLRHMANHDSLTGLPTRRLGMERISSALSMARRNKSKAAVLFVDLDGFKGVNDVLGHEAGDQLLVSVAERLSSCLREVDTVARIGGDEFMIVLADIKNHANAENIAIKLVNSVAQSFAIGVETVTIGASIGIAVYPDDAQEPEALLKQADKAMYGVKAKGKSDFAFCSTK